MTTITATELKTFNFKTNAIRIIDRDGQPWFVASDVCRALHLSVMKNGQPNVTEACRRLADDERGLSPIETPIPTKADHRTNMKVVSESGLYKLIMRSDKPEAVAFQEWVTREVLPAIRKTGGYMLAGADREAIHEGQDAAMPDVAGKRWLRAGYRGESCTATLSIAHSDFWQIQSGARNAWVLYIENRLEGVHNVDQVSKLASRKIVRSINNTIADQQLYARSQRVGEASGIGCR